MKQSLTFIPTMRETPSDAEIRSHQLLLRAGFIRQTTSGIYSYLPFGKKVLSKIRKIIREEMDAIDAVEVLMPAMQHAELWQEIREMVQLRSRIISFKRPSYIESLLSERLMKKLSRHWYAMNLKSYKQLPLTMYQIQTEFRDEQRPRFGLLRSQITNEAPILSMHLKKVWMESEDLKQHIQIYLRDSVLISVL